MVEPSVSPWNRIDRRTAAAAARCAARASLIAASTASVPVLAGTIAATLAGARASSCSARTPGSSETPSCGRFAVEAASTSWSAAITSVMRTADREDAVAGDEIEVAVAVGIDQVRALAAHPGPVEPERPQDAAHLHVEVAVVQRHLLAGAAGEQLTNLRHGAHRSVAGTVSHTSAPPLRAICRKRVAAVRLGDGPHGSTARDPRRRARRPRRRGRSRLGTRDGRKSGSESRGPRRARAARRSPRCASPRAAVIRHRRRAATRCRPCSRARARATRCRLRHRGAVVGLAPRRPAALARRRPSRAATASSSIATSTGRRSSGRPP